jgi:hypothetical protein
VLNSLTAASAIPDRIGKPWARPTGFRIQRSVLVAVTHVRTLPGAWCAKDRRDHEPLTEWPGPGRGGDGTQPRTARLGWSFLRGSDQRGQPGDHCPAPVSVPPWASSTRPADLTGEQGRRCASDNAQKPFFS